MYVIKELQGIMSKGNKWNTILFIRDPIQVYEHLYIFPGFLYLSTSKYSYHLLFDKPSHREGDDFVDSHH